MFNIYDNNLRTDQVRGALGRNTRRRVMVDVERNTILGGRTVLLNDFNKHSPQWNLHGREKRDATRLEAFIKAHDLIFNEGEKATRLTRG